MASERADKLIQKLERGLSKSQEVFHSLASDQWEQPAFEGENPWSVRQLASHFIYAEEHLLEIAKFIARGGEGSLEEIDIQAFNEREMERMGGMGVEELTAGLVEARQATLAWVQGLDDPTLELEGRHPVLGIVNIETIIHSIYAHQLLHMRETAPMLRGD